MMNDKRLRIDLDDHLALMVTEIERPNRSRPRDPFSPQPNWRRRTLPAVHREVARWLRHQAVVWGVTTEQFMQLCSLRIGQSSTRGWTWPHQCGSSAGSVLLTDRA